ncbi:hypothetical protein HPB51_023268 [Rhipicephalus microplus]|uniref:AAA+ ATPase domain-containing protein n=1 Tax=Rhipicephalus microplus TaxID=6941 RepID=A0A9J6F992_RHIMP|nr:hypothetical protein HPB51_023268 [Rhipicephalus microplus]
MAESKTAKSFVDGHIADTEEQKSAVRKRNLLILILHYLQHEGLMTTAESLKTESTLKLDQYVLCDNVDLELILQEYETFQFVKFRKQPHITRKLEGTGKTLLAKAVATECKTTFFNITASTLVSKWRGESEKLVRVLFELARHNSPATIFLDELDALVGAKGGLGNSENEASRRMKSELLIQMDGLSNSKDHVFVLATSNSHGKEARTFLFHKFLEGGQSAKSGGRRESCFVAADIDYNLVSEASEGYSGSDIKIACKEAVMKSLRQALEAAECCDNEADGTDRIIPEPVSTEDILDAIKQTKPTGKALAAKFETWHQEYGSSLS